MLQSAALLLINGPLPYSNIALGQPKLYQLSGT